MGNQLFQLAATIATALKNKTSYLIPQKVKKGQLAVKVASTYDGTPNGTEWIYEEPHFHYAPIPYKSGICLSGYFQSYKYFEGYEEDILQALGLNSAVWKGIVGVHVRRGDYLLLPEKFPVVTVEYIREAMGRFRNHKFFFFSDDIAWCREKFPGHHYADGSAQDDFQQMLCCEHLIISNSSFSLMAALLNRNKEKIVYAPKVWFGPAKAHLDTKDLLPQKGVVI